MYVYIYDSPLKIRKNRNITVLEIMSYWIIDVYLTLIQKAHKVSILFAEASAS